MTYDTSLFPPRQHPQGTRPPRSRISRGRRRRRVLSGVLVTLVLVSLGLAAVALRSPRSPGSAPDLAAVTGAGVDAPTPADTDADTPATNTGTGTGTAGGDTGTPATGLDPELQRRFDAAQAGAAADGIELSITSGWRSADEQQRIVDQTVEKYGSAEEAHKWVLPPEQSAHVAGLAIDVGATEGAYWLTEHGLEYGLCRTYVNEVWHFEPLAAGATQCPEPHEDSSWGW